jgi:hypothetical protein
MKETTGFDGDSFLGILSGLLGEGGNPGTAVSGD